MVERFSEFICKYIQGKADAFKGCLIAALENKEGYNCYLAESQGATIPSQDIKDSEVLTDAGLFREEIKLTRNGRNLYKLFYLTDLGREMAEQIQEEGYDGKIPENAPMI